MVYMVENAMASLSREHVSIKTLLDIDTRYSLCRQVSNSGIWDWNLKSGCIYCCPKMRSMLRLRGRRMEGGLTAWANRLAFEDRQRFKEDFEKHVKGRQRIWCGEYRTAASTGNRWMLFRGVVAFSGEREAGRVLGLLTDVTSVRHEAPPLIRQSLSA